ncbi:MAG TPA: hypothetical protein VN851_27395 [Thermoanaerobaculia bacterium]|nr:hypothetical protein [Thermoanaerobaculia bacterium]
MSTPRLSVFFVLALLALGLGGSSLFAATIDPEAQPMTVLFQCNGPTSSDPSIKFQATGGLTVLRPVDPTLYRKPRIGLRFSIGTGPLLIEKYRVQQAFWCSPTTGGVSGVCRTTNPVRTKLIAASGGPRTFDAITLDYISNGSFQPVSAKLFVQQGNKTTTITFASCGPQSTSAYYWTPSSMNRNEAFACQTNDQPPGCPGVQP